MSKYPLEYYFSKARKEPVGNPREDIKAIMAQIPSVRQTGTPWNLIVWGIVASILLTVGFITLSSYLHKDPISTHGYLPANSSPQNHPIAETHQEATSLPETISVSNTHHEKPSGIHHSENRIMRALHLHDETASEHQEYLTKTATPDIQASPFDSSPGIIRRSKNVHSDFPSVPFTIPSRKWFRDMESSASLGFSAGIGCGVSTTMFYDINSRLQAVNLPTLSQSNPQVDIHGFLLYQRWKLGAEYGISPSISSTGTLGDSKESVRYSSSYIAVLGGYNAPLTDALSLMLGYKISFDTYTLSFSHLDIPASGISDWDMVWEGFSSHSSTNSTDVALSRNTVSFHPVFELNWIMSNDFALNLGIEGSFSLQPHKDWTLATSPNQTVYGGNVNFAPNSLTIKTSFNFQSFPF